MRQETISLIECSISLIALLQIPADSPEDIFRWPTGTSCLNFQFGTIAQYGRQTPAGFVHAGHGCNLYLVDLFVILPVLFSFDNEFVLCRQKTLTSHPIMSIMFGFSPGQRPAAYAGFCLNSEYFCIERKRGLLKRAGCPYRPFGR